MKYNPIIYFFLCLELICLALVSPAPGDMYSEDFEYEEDTILTGRDADNITYPSVNGYRTSIRTANDINAGGIGAYGDRTLVVKHDPQHADLKGYITYSNNMRKQNYSGIIFWKKQQHREISEAISGYPFVIYELTYKALGHVSFSAGRMYGREGTKWHPAFTFTVGAIWNNLHTYRITDAEGRVHKSPDESDTPGHSIWVDVRFIIDVQANGNNGSLDFYYKRHDSKEWLSKDVFKGINLHLASNPKIDSPDKWTCWKGVLDGWQGYTNRQCIARVRAYGVKESPVMRCGVAAGKRTNE